MASRRMIAIRVVDSTKFLKMPISTQALYFHLITRADDDGIVEAFNIMRMAGSTEDDLRVLSAKGYVTVLNEDLVAYINDWEEHNKIRADRKIDSMYKSLLLQIVPDALIKEKKQRADAKKTVLLEDGRTMDGQRTDNGRHRLGKDRLGKDNIYMSPNGNNEEKKNFIPPTLEEVQAYCNERNNGIEAESFIDWYQSKGWMIGKNKMRDWKAAVRTWEKKNDKQQQKQPSIDDMYKTL